MADRPTRGKPRASFTGAAAIAAALLGLAFAAKNAAAGEKLVVQNALIISMAPGQKKPFTGYIIVGDDGRIAKIGEGAPPAGSPTWTFDAGGKIVIPGFLSGHSHLTQSVLRGLAPGSELIDWIQAMIGMSKGGYIPGDLYTYALHGSIDYLRHGITTCYNYTGRGLTTPPERYNENFFAELESGQRFVFGLSLPGLAGPEAMHKAFDEFVKTIAPYRSDPHFLKLSLAKNGLMSRGGEKSIDTEAEIAAANGLDVQMHYLEPNLGHAAEQKAFAQIQSSGILKCGVMYAHFIHTNDAIVQASGAAHARMIWNPLSNGRLASGLADVLKYKAAGIKVGMGIDGQASADMSDPFENMRMGLYQTRMRHESSSIMSPYDILRMHTLGTAEAMAVEKDVGSLEPGKYADFVVVDPALMDTGPIFDAYATLVFACSIANLDWVFVGGEPVVRRGEPLKINNKQLDREAHDRVAAMLLRIKAAPTP